MPPSATTRGVGRCLLPVPPRSYGYVRSPRAARAATPAPSPTSPASGAHTASAGWRPSRTAPRPPSCVSSAGTTRRAAGTVAPWRWRARIPKLEPMRWSAWPPMRSASAGSPPPPRRCGRAEGLLDGGPARLPVRLGVGVGRVGDGHRRRPGCGRTCRTRGRAGGSVRLRPSRGQVRRRTGRRVEQRRQPRPIARGGRRGASNYCARWVYCP